jgi:hypothetical protein
MVRVIWPENVEGNEPPKMIRLASCRAQVQLSQWRCGKFGVAEGAPMAALQKPSFGAVADTP